MICRMTKRKIDDDFPLSLDINLLFIRIADP